MNELITHLEQEDLLLEKLADIKEWNFSLPDLYEKQEYGVEKPQFTTPDRPDLQGKQVNFLCDKFCYKQFNSDF